MEKLEQLSTAQDAVHVSKATMKRRVAAGESILPPPSGPPPDDGKSGKGGGGLRKTQTETQRILAEQLENARNRAQRANPTNQACRDLKTNPRPPSLVVLALVVVRSNPPSRTPSRGRVA